MRLSKKKIKCACIKSEVGEGNQHILKSKDLLPSPLPLAVQGTYVGRRQIKSRLAEMALQILSIYKAVKLEFSKCKKNNFYL